MEQIALDFEPGLLDRFPEFGDTIVHVVYSGRKAQKSIASDLDESPSALSRKVKGELEFPARKLPALIESTGDLTPIYWLIERFLQPTPDDREKAIRRAMAICERFPEIQAVLASVANASAKGKRR